jgi:intracellular sulfur oxidation DsrE/DsrF family protein
VPHEEIPMTTYRVLFHLDEPSKGRAEQVLRNIENLLADLGDENVQVEMVANGGGVKALVQSPDTFEELIEKLARRGVHFIACAHSLDALKIDQASLLNPVEVVPAGIGELVRKQAEGWAYIRP